MRDCFNFDPVGRIGKRHDLNSRCSGEVAAKELAPCVMNLLARVDIRDEDRNLHDIVHCAARAFHQRFDLAEDEFGLGINALAFSCRHAGYVGYAIDQETIGETLIGGLGNRGAANANDS